MNSEMETGMQEIPLEDVDEDSMEFKLLMAFAQRNLSDSRFQELIKNRDAQVWDEKKGKMVEPMNGQGGKAPRDLSPNAPLTFDSKHTKVDQKKRKKARWKRMIPQCIRGERLEYVGIIKEGEQLEMKNEKGAKESEASLESVFKQEGGDVDPKKPSYQSGHVRKCKFRSSFHSSDPESQCLSGSVSVEDNEVSGDSAPDPVEHIADHLVGILHDAPDYSSDTGYRAMSRSFSVEADGISDEEALIQQIAAVLRESGDRLQEEIKSDQTLYQGIRKLLTSYSYFTKVTDLYVGNQVIEEEMEIQQQSVKIAFAMDITTKLTAIDNHPMNKVLGFGVKYLKEKFSPWIQEHGGWEKAFAVMDEEEVD
ncbi:apoptosis facilitator Bcl-2-like protein 14 isoform X1 [Pleurodeles waltl]|uniref:apoptosis facilitator Bcl-2-like protein 14 isoform X1 n=1 Tax=Pleurodeles waltl TaxID=8319 RepID=UPI0037093EBB